MLDPHSELEHGEFIKACSEGDFKRIFNKDFTKLSADDINHCYYHVVDNNHKELANALHVSNKINQHTNVFAFVDASQNCNLLMAQQCYNSNIIPFSEVRWALHKTGKEKKDNCREVISWLKTLKPDYKKVS